MNVRLNKWDTIHFPNFLACIDDPADRERLFERAAIKEYDGRMDRAEAEKQTALEWMNRRVDAPSVSA